MILRDLKFTDYRPRKSGGISVALSIKPEDITDEQKKAIEKAWQAGISIDVAIEIGQEIDYIQSATIQDSDLEKSARNKFYATRKEYCDLKNMALHQWKKIYLKDEKATTKDLPLQEIINLTNVLEIDIQDLLNNNNNNGESNQECPF